MVCSLSLNDTSEKIYIMTASEKNILIVDDSGVARMHMCSILSQKGYSTRQAENGFAALAKISEKLPDLMTLDLLMPEMDGTELLEKLKDLNYKIPIIVISADIQDDVKNECFENGVTAFLNKPFKVEELLELVGKILK